MQKEASVSKNIVWSVAERLSSQGLYFVISIVLARLILPDIYGLVNIVNVVVNLFSLVIQSSFSSALIVDNNADDRKYSSAFWSTLIFTVLLYGTLFATAPLIAAFYNYPALALYIRVMSLQLILQGIYSIPFAYVSKHMMFSKTVISTFVGVAVSGATAIWMAMNGMEVWALICINGIEVAVSTVILWILIRFRVRFVLDIKSLLEMWRYCWKLMTVDFLNSLYTNINSLIIGKKYQSSDVAYYNKAYSLPQMLLGSVNTAVSKVLFPAFAQVKNSVDETREMLRMSIRVMNYIILPMLTGLAAVSYDLISLLFGEAWIETVPYLQLMCVVWMFQPIQTNAAQAMKALGKGSTYLKIEGAKKACGLVILIVCLIAGTSAISLAWALVVGQFVSTLLNMPVLKKHFKYRYRMQIKDMMASVLMNALMFALVWGVGKLIDGLILRLIVQVAVGGFSYLLMSLITKNENLMFVFNKIKNR